MDTEYHVISTLVEDKPGVLQKVAGMFNRRGFQLNKLIDVIKIKDITKSAVKRELCLVKVAVPNAKARAERN